MYESGVFTGSGPKFKNKLAVTAFKLSSTEYSGSVPVNNFIGLFENLEDLPIKYGLIVICSDSAAFGV